MIPVQFRPKFITKESVQRAMARITSCSICKTERTLPEGKTAIVSACSDCLREIEFRLKDTMGGSGTKLSARGRLGGNKSAL